MNPLLALLTGGATPWELDDPNASNWEREKWRRLMREKFPGQIPFEGPIPLPNQVPPTPNPALLGGDAAPIPFEGPIQEGPTPPWEGPMQPDPRQAIMQAQHNAEFNRDRNEHLMRTTFGGMDVPTQVNIAERFEPTYSGTLDPLANRDPNMAAYTALAGRNAFQNNAGGIGRQTAEGVPYLLKHLGGLRQGPAMDEQADAQRLEKIGERNQERSDDRFTQRMILAQKYGLPVSPSDDTAFMLDNKSVRDALRAAGPGQARQVWENILRDRTSNLAKSDKARSNIRQTQQARSAMDPSLLPKTTVRNTGGATALGLMGGSPAGLLAASGMGFEGVADPEQIAGIANDRRRMEAYARRESGSPDQRRSVSGSALLDTLGVKGPGGGASTALDIAKKYQQLWMQLPPQQKNVDTYNTLRQLMAADIQMQADNMKQQGTLQAQRDIASIGAKATTDAANTRANATIMAAGAGQRERAVATDKATSTAEKKTDESTIQSRATALAGNIDALIRYLNTATIQGKPLTDDQKVAFMAGAGIDTKKVQAHANKVGLNKVPSWTQKGLGVSHSVEKGGFRWPTFSW